MVKTTHVQLTFYILPDLELFLTGEGRRPQPDAETEESPSSDTKTLPNFITLRE